jgi:hypothetical protein
VARQSRAEFWSDRAWQMVSIVSLRGFPAVQSSIQALQGNDDAAASCRHVVARDVVGARLSALPKSR